MSKIIKHNIVKYVKNKKKKYIDLKIRIKTINVLLKRQLIDRFCKDAIKNKFNLNFVYVNLNLAYINLNLT